MPGWNAGTMIHTTCTHEQLLYCSPLICLEERLVGVKSRWIYLNMFFALNSPFKARDKFRLRRSESRNHVACVIRFGSLDNLRLVGGEERSTRGRANSMRPQSSIEA